MSTTVELRDETTTAGRLVYLDRFRGLAVLCMVVDHLTLVLGGPAELRLTVGRLAMPMFFVLAGTLASRPRWRHLQVGLAGVLLPLVVPWIDNPNVLLIWALGVLLLWAVDLAGLPRWLPVVVGLALYANGWEVADGNYYPNWALWGLMALGAMIPRSSYSWATRVPSWVGVLGRWPVSFYVGHLVALQLLVVVAR